MKNYNDDIYPFPEDGTINPVGMRYYFPSFRHKKGDEPLIYEVMEEQNAADFDKLYLNSCDDERQVNVQNDGYKGDALF